MRNITKVLNWTEKFKTFGILPKYKKKKKKYLQVASAAHERKWFPVTLWRFFTKDMGVTPLGSYGKHEVNDAIRSKPHCRITRTSGELHITQ